MTFIDPILFSGKSQVIAYKNKRVKDWEEMKGESKTDFDSYFEEISAKWDIAFDDEQTTESDNESSENTDENNESLTTAEETNASATVEESNAPTSAGLYNPDDIELDTVVGLTDEEKRYIEAIALMEWNFMIMNRRTNQKTQKKSISKAKKEKKEIEQEEARFQAMLEAKHRADEASRRKSKKK